MKQYIYSIGDTSWQVEIGKGTYSNNRIGMWLEDVNDREDGYVSDITVNLPDEELEPGYVFIKDYAENEGMLQWCIDNKIVEPPTEYVQSGWVTIPKCKLLI